jgi:hypothetical protein
MGALSLNDRSAISRTRTKPSQSIGAHSSDGLADLKVVLKNMEPRSLVHHAQKLPANP